MYASTPASQVFPGMMALALCRQTLSPAIYRQQQRQHIRQVSGWEVISGLKGGLLLAQIGPKLAGVIGCHGLAKHLFQVLPRELEIALGHIESLLQSPRARAIYVHRKVPPWSAYPPPASVSGSVCYNPYAIQGDICGSVRLFADLGEISNLAGQK